MAKRTKWVKEPYKSVIKPEATPDDLPMAVRRPVRKKVDWSDVLFFLMIEIFAGAVALASVAGIVALWVFCPLMELGAWSYVINVLGTALLLALALGSVSMIISKD